MTITTVSSHALNQDLVRARKDANSGPVFITDRGKPAHVLSSIEDNRRLTGQGRSLTEALSMTGFADIDFDPARTRIEAVTPGLSRIFCRMRT